ncbi:MAG: peptide ABC transporter permease [Betaproteobacteria bacterium SG8_40]|nr:MAG: peptide ABC transporter permease [Betaproteobacteria bacterium SG8_40]
MPFKPVVLWTDALLFLLLASAIAFWWHARARPHLRRPWTKLAGSSRGMASLVFIGFFLVVGLLDSVHFRERIAGEGSSQQFAAQTRSLLDAIVGPLGSRTEKTYSAPLATHLFAKETVELADGARVRTYPRLRYGGAHLSDPASEWQADVLRTAIAGLGVAAILWNVLALAVTALVARRSQRSFTRSWHAIWHGLEAVPWRAILCSAGVLILLLAPLAVLSTKYHVLGTDKVGQDVFYLTLKSIRTGLLIATLSTLVMLPLATALGIMAGYFRGWVDDIIQYVYTTLNSIPGVLLIAAAVLMLQVYMGTHPEVFDTIEQRQDLRLLFLCLILGVTSWTGLCRLLRGETLKLREQEYVQAARAFGVSHVSIISRHILPNVMHIILIAVVMDFSGLVLAEAVLSYVGVGVDPTMTSFGNMINAARLEMAREPMVWWSLASAFVFMLMMVLSANLFADAVRDAFDPRVNGNGREHA